MGAERNRVALDASGISGVQPGDGKYAYERGEKCESNSGCVEERQIEWDVGEVPGWDRTFWTSKTRRMSGVSMRSAC